MYIIFESVRDIENVSFSHGRIETINTCFDPGCLRSKSRMIYRKTSNISRALIGNKIVDHSDVVGASPAVAAPTTSSFST